MDIACIYTGRFSSRNRFLYLLAENVTMHITGIFLTNVFPPPPIIPPPFFTPTANIVSEPPPFFGGIPTRDGGLPKKKTPSPIR